MRVCVYLCLCVRVCACVCVFMCVCVNELMFTMYIMSSDNSKMGKRTGEPQGGG